MFEQIEVHGAKRALHRVALGSQDLKPTTSEYMFRGQGDTKWSAIPSAFRSDAKLFSEDRLYPLGRRTNRDQIHTELFMMVTFARELNQAGLHLGGESILNILSDDYTRFHTEIGRSETIWPPTRLHGIMALAQHYGLPTRLLDLTWDPCVALYFAAKKALEIQSEYFSVYALSSMTAMYRGIENDSSTEHLYKLTGKRHPRREYCLVQTPSHLNNNLRAQKGFFLTYVEAPFFANGKFSPLSLEDVSHNEERPGAMHLKKFVIATRYAEEILHILATRFYTATMLFPGYAGAVAGLNDKYFFNKNY